MHRLRKQPVTLTISDTSRKSMISILLALTISRASIYKPQASNSRPHHLKVQPPFHPSQCQQRIAQIQRPNVHKNLDNNRTTTTPDPPLRPKPCKIPHTSLPSRLKAGHTTRDHRLPPVVLDFRIRLQWTQLAAGLLLSCL